MRRQIVLAMAISGGSPLVGITKFSAIAIATTTVSRSYGFPHRGGAARTISGLSDLSALLSCAHSWIPVDAFTQHFTKDIVQYCGDNQLVRGAEHFSVSRFSACARRFRLR